MDDHRLRNIAPDEMGDAIGWRDDQIKRLRRELDIAYQMLEINGVPRERAKSVHNGIDVLVTRLRRELAEVKSDLAAAERGHDAAHAACVKYERELAEAQRDAARYRWVRSRTGVDGWWHIKYNDTPEKVDAAIDAAMSEPKEPQP